jgi:Rrf2 family protein
VTDVAINSKSRPVPAKALAARHKLPPRHLEPVLQALVRDGILRGTRGPQGGYELARDQAKITAEDLLNSAGRLEQTDEPLPESALIDAVVQPALAVAEVCFSVALRAITVGDLARAARNLHQGGADSFDVIQTKNSPIGR